MMRATALPCVLACGLALAGPAAAGPDGVPEKYRPAVHKGLAWLVKQQHKDGHWSAAGGQHPVALTALAGMALLGEGSTTRDGKYAVPLRRAADWLTSRSQPNGLIGNPDNPSEAGLYLFGHGYAVLFLASAYEGEKDAARRRKLGDALNRAVRFTAVAQTSRGGWGYIAAKDGFDFDEGACTACQVQALRAARLAGIPVPSRLLTSARKYLKRATTARGGVIYSLSSGNNQERPALTAAAIAAAYAPSDYATPPVKNWIRYCQIFIPAPVPIGRFSNDEFTRYYYAQAVHGLGDKGHAKLFPDLKATERLHWTKYREVLFDALARAQGADGAWPGGAAGPVYVTALSLTILQLDNETIPIYQR